MRTRRVQRCGRGLVRGLFLSAMVAGLWAGCDKAPPAKKPDVSAAPADVGEAHVDAGSAAVAADAAPDLPPPPPPEFTPPWTTLAPTLKELDKQLGDTQVGKMSGEAWGTDAAVAAIVRAQCGSGSLLQAVFRTAKGLRVSPAMPVRFFGLATKKPVTYKEGAFTVTANFSEDTPERLAGSLKIVYDEHGQEKTFIDMTVDGKPLPMLLEPRMDGKGTFPEFRACHPSGRFYAKTADGRVVQGLLNASLSSDGTGAVLTALFTDQTGLRIVAYSANPLDKPWTIDLSKDTEGSPVRLVVDAFYTPELTSPETALGGNIGSEKTATARQGLAELTWQRRSKRGTIGLRFKDLRIPELLDGPLRGTTFTELVIDAVGFPQDEYPDAPSAEPLEPGPQE